MKTGRIENKQKKNQLFSEKAFTMVELTVSMAVAVIITLITLAAFHWGTRVWDVTHHQLWMAGEMRLGVEEITRELENASASNILVPSSNVLQYQIPESIDDEGNILWSDWYEYHVSNNQLIRENLTDSSEEVVADRVSSVSFSTSGSPSRLNISMTVTKATNFGIDITVSRNWVVEFRN